MYGAEPTLDGWCLAKASRLIVRSEVVDSFAGGVGGDRARVLEGSGTASAGASSDSSTAFPLPL